MRLAIVDDERPTLEILKDNLKPTGFETVVFDDPVQAIESIKDGSFDVVITDFKMPGMTGIDVLKSVKKINQTTYVIIVTGYADIYNTIEAVNHGAFAFFRKPLNFQDFIETLLKIEKEIIDQKRGNKVAEERQSS